MPPCHCWFALTGLLVWLATVASASEPHASWSDFRGPRGDGHSEATGLPWQWNEQQNVAWKTPLPGRGWSSPVVWGDQAWMTTATEDGHRLSVLAVDLHTGRLIHELDLFHVAEPEPIDTTNSYASPSPVIEAGRVYVHFGTYGTACIATDTGKTVWARRDFPVDHQKGPGSSPILFGDLLIFQCDGNDVQYVVALEKTTGRTAWRTARSVDLSARDPDYRKSFSTPLLLEHDGQPQLVIWHAESVNGLDPETGRPLWSVPLDPNYAMSIVTPRQLGRYLFVGGIVNKSALLRLSSSPPAADVVWRGKRELGIGPVMVTPMLEDEYLYGVDGKGELRCVELATGEQLWTNYSAATSGDRGAHSACAFLVKQGDRFFLASETGELIIARLSPEKYSEVSRAKIIEPTGTAFGRSVWWSHPAFANRCVYARNDKELICVSLAADDHSR